MHFKCRGVCMRIKFASKKKKKYVIALVNVLCRLTVTLGISQLFATIAPRAETMDGRMYRCDMDIIRYLIIFFVFSRNLNLGKNCAFVFEIFKVIPGFWIRAIILRAFCLDRSAGRRSFTRTQMNEKYLLPDYSGRAV